MAMGFMGGLSLPVAASAAADKLAWGALYGVLERLAEPPLTLVHGDFRPENLRFAPSAAFAATSTAAAGPAVPRVAAFDWGLAHLGRGAWDLAYCIILSQPPEVRRQREAALVSTYLRASGDSTEQKLREELRFAALGILSLIIMTRAGAKSYESKQMLGRMLVWVGEAIEDWQAIDAISDW
mmetsp:Transcript_114051/g.362615  ORF Transcript_114051/g.362615 Transcript_114051/m.362615 type:complete len:182 (+) Transcript_114051:492-1037(+)